MTAGIASGGGRPAATAADVRRLCGDVADDTVAAILATGATLQELEEALAWAAGESDVMGRARRPLQGVVAELYDILTADDALWQERDAEGSS